MSMSATLNALKMTKKLSSRPKNQYIVPFNLLIIRSSLRIKSLRCYMMCWGNSSNYTEILKCCGWKLIPELHVIGSSEDCCFPQLNFTNVFIVNDSKDDAVRVFICCNHWVAATRSRYLLYNVQWPAPRERLLNTSRRPIASARRVTAQAAHGPRGTRSPPGTRHRRAAPRPVAGKTTGQRIVFKNTLNLLLGFCSLKLLISV